jgi:hypothetical protein
VFAFIRRNSMACDPLESLLSAIVDDDRASAGQLLKPNPALATLPTDEPRLYDSSILHWLYAGDTALHLAAAGHRVEIVALMLDAGADVNVAGKHRLARPLHYAADGYVTGPAWDAKRQVKSIRRLLDAGADINAQDKNGATPLHRAVRTRCADAVRLLLKSGADPKRKNKPGSTPFHLAVQNTGRGGSGAEVAKAAQRRIIAEFLSIGLSPTLKDGHGKAVADSARSEWIQQMLLV